MVRAPDAPVRVAILGCGNVGSALVELLTTRADAIAAATGVRFEIAGVAVASLDRPRPSAVPNSLVTADAKGLVGRDDVDLVVELIGGLEPAGSLVEMALRAGRPVITANKALLARSGPELS